MGSSREVPETVCACITLATMVSVHDTEKRRCSRLTPKQDGDWMGGIYSSIYFCLAADCPGAFKKRASRNAVLLVSLLLYNQWGSRTLGTGSPGNVPGLLLKCSRACLTSASSCKRGGEESLLWLMGSGRLGPVDSGRLWQQVPCPSPRWVATVAGIHPQPMLLVWAHQALHPSPMWESVATVICPWPTSLAQASKPWALPPGRKPWQLPPMHGLCLQLRSLSSTLSSGCHPWVVHAFFTSQPSPTSLPRWEAVVAAAHYDPCHCRPVGYHSSASREGQAQCPSLSALGLTRNTAGIGRKVSKEHVERGRGDLGW